jgi:hypothetical protein
MLTRSVAVATTLAVGLVAGVGSSALAVAFVPADDAGSAQSVLAIADTGQDPSDGASFAFLSGTPTVVTLPPVSLDGASQKDAPDADASSETSTDDPTPAPTESGVPTEDSASGENGNSGNGNSGNGNGNSGSGNSGSGSSGQSDAEKAAEKQAKKDKKAAEEQAKKDKKAAEEQAKKDKKSKSQTDDEVEAGT